MMTPLGYVVALFALGLMFAPLRVVFTALLISLPFTATSVMDISLGKSPLVISPSLLFGAVFLMRALFTARRFTVNLWLFVGIVVCIGAAVFSIGWNIVAPQPVSGFDIFTQHLVHSTTAVTRSTYTQTAYWVFWLLVVLMVHVCRNHLRFDWMRVVFGVAMFVSVWGLAQFTASVLHLSFPDKLFNNSSSPFLQGYLQQISDTTVRRTTSVTAEPSFLAAFLLPLLAYGVHRLLAGQRELPLMRLILLTMLVATAVSTSSTGYVGLAVLAVGFFVALIVRSGMRFLITRKLVLTVFGLLFVGLPVAWYVVTVHGATLYDFTVGKAGSSSFSARASTVQAALDLGQRSPVFGGSIGPVTAFSLPIWLFASLGVIGLLAFVLLVAASFRYVLLRRTEQSAALISLLLISLLTTTVAGFPFQYGVYWLPFILIAVSIPVSSSVPTPVPASRSTGQISRRVRIGNFTIRL